MVFIERWALVNLDVNWKKKKKTVLITILFMF